MSYILDALKKSEQERRAVAETHAGTPYPIEIKRERSPWLVWMLLVVAGAVIVTLVWRAVMRPLEANVPNAIDKPVAIGKLANISAPQPAAPDANSVAAQHLRAVPPLQAAVVPPPPVAGARMRDAPQHAAANPKEQVAEPESVRKPKKKTAEPAQKKTADKQAAETLKPVTTEAPPSAPAKTEAVDPLKGMPELVIKGYIRDEQNGSLAMINNQLVREGEEISPGLRLIKILDDSAVFSYKGYVFSR